MKRISTYSEYQESISEGRCLLKISAPWCGPCKVVAENIHLIEGDYPDVNFVEVDADDCDENILSELSVRGVPVVIAYKDGSVVDRSAGLQTVEQLRERLDNLN